MRFVKFRDMVSKGIDSINHLAGNFIIGIDLIPTREVFAYATATHYKGTLQSMENP